MYAKAGYSYNINNNFEVGFLTGMYTNEKNEHIYKEYENHYIGVGHKFSYRSVSIDLYTKYAFFENQSSPFIKIGASKLWDKLNTTIRADDENLRPSLYQHQAKESINYIDKFIAVGYDMRMPGSEKYDLPIRISFELTKHFGGTSVTFLNKSSLMIIKVPNPKYPNSNIYQNIVQHSTLTKKLNTHTFSISLIMPL